MLDIDEDILLKFQSESLAVAVFGMQDGREKFGKKLKNAFVNKDADKNKINLNATGNLSLNQSDK